ncbi:hypothetical protein BIV57_06425 [Mangrovactinospora gilvigrisea]|uniref:DUF1772 domain-containing protein n=1 Tax=Mangrovactinospora gilvigrisea TaxID=1428644 RepID=A0A1J7C9U1_9ACTN|nr:anthrone oxygenase family protein [Mangrovactinospora gilvigrisea]OIV38296.1 hypothetical protein BIV57_06425 [Mangrovactinospora gilvigrisea]
MLNALEVVTVVVTGVMVGVEFAVATVLNRIFAGLGAEAELAGRAHGGRMLGRLMPFWYFTALGLSAIWAGFAWGDHGAGLVVAAAAMLVVSVLMSVLVLVPINNQSKNWTPETAPENSRELAHKWDVYHYFRVTVIIAAFALQVCALV